MSNNMILPLFFAAIPSAGINASAGNAAEPGKPAEGTAARQRPNIIYIMTDQQWAGAMSCAGNPDLNTPNMDRLAQNGVRFTNAYCSFPLSGPSRAAMFTGYMPSESGIVENEKPLTDSLAARTLGTLVSEAGYNCAYAGKWHVNTVSLPANEAFGFHNIKDNGDRGIAEACVKFLQERPGKQPFFLVASYTNPHNICEFARGQETPMAKIDKASTADCPNLPDNFAVQPYDASILQFEKGLNYSLYPTTTFTPDDWRQYRNAYYRLVEAVDAEIGKIIDEIDRQGLWKNTVMIFTSDHGDGCGAHQWNQKTALYEEVANIPLIVCLPGKANAGTTSDALVNEGIDLMPSVCDWAEATVPAGRSGKSFRNAAESAGITAPDKKARTGKEMKGSQTGQEYIVTETNFLQTSGTLGWMVRTPRYKYVLYDKGQYREQLYDMENDRGEMQNLAVESRYQEVLQQHRDILREWFLTHPATTLKMRADGLTPPVTDRPRHIRLIPE